MGIYSCLGKDITQVRDSLYTGRSGMVLDQSRKEVGFRSGLSGTVERLELKGKLKRRQRKGLAEKRGICLYIKQYIALISFLDRILGYRKLPESGLERPVTDYAEKIEHMIRKYPDQWFNYYPFWGEN